MDDALLRRLAANQQAYADRLLHQQRRSQPTYYQGFDAAYGMPVVETTQGSSIAGRSITNGLQLPGQRVRTAGSGLRGAIDSMPRVKRETMETPQTVKTIGAWFDAARVSGKNFLDVDPIASSLSTATQALIDLSGLEIENVASFGVGDLSDYVAFWSGLPASNQAFTVDEIDAIVDYVEGGGRLFLQGENSFFRFVIDPLSSRFGLVIRDAAFFGEIVANPVAEHPIVEGITAITTNLPGAWSEEGVDRLTIVSFLGMPMAYAFDFEAGKIVAVSDVNCFGNDRLELTDNKQFWLNCWNWLLE